MQSHRQAKGLNEQKSPDSLKYRLRTRRKAAIQTAKIQSMIQAKDTRVALSYNTGYKSTKQATLD